MNIVFCWIDNPEDPLLNAILRELLQKHNVCVQGRIEILEQVSARFGAIENLSFIDRIKKKTSLWADCFFCSSSPANAMLDIPRYIFTLNQGDTDENDRDYDFLFSVSAAEEKAGPVFQSTMTIGRDAAAVAAEIKNVISWIGSNYLMRGVFPEASVYSRDALQEQIRGEYDLNELLVQRRFCATQNCIAACSDMDPQLDWSLFYPQQNALCYFSLSGKQGKQIRPYKELRRTVAQLKGRYYLQNSKRNDGIGDSYRYTSRYVLKQNTELLEEYEHASEPHESLCFYAGNVYWELDQKVYALDCYKTYLSAALSKTQGGYSTDNVSDRETALLRSFSVLETQSPAEEDGRLELARQFLRLADETGEEWNVPDVLITSAANCMSGGGFDEEYKALLALKERKEQAALALLQDRNSIILVEGDDADADEQTDAEAQPAIDDAEKTNLRPAGAFERVSRSVSDGVIQVPVASSPVQEKSKKKGAVSSFLSFLGHGIGWRLRAFRKKLGSYLKRLAQYVKRNYPWTRSIIRPVVNGWTDLRRLLHIYTEEEQDVLQYKDICSGKACFIIGNGPSLRADDLERIQAEGFTCFASNKIYKIFELTDWRPDYYACIDEDVFYQNLSQILTQIKCPMFLHTRMQKAVKRYKTVLQQKVEDVHYCRYRWRRNARFIPQVANTLSGGSVTFTLIELAWMMGYRDFYIIGCDHFYSSFSGVSATQKSMTSSADTNKDYFIKDYMKPGEIIRVGNIDRLTEGYILARDYIAKHGGRIRNATRGGYLEVFERVDLDALLAEHADKTEETV